MFFSFGKYFTLTFIEPNSLLLEHRRWSAFLDLLGLFGACVVLGLMVLSQPADKLSSWGNQFLASASRNPLTVLLFTIVIAVFAQGPIRNIRIVMRGSRVLFDASAHRIFVNERMVASFRDVIRVRVTKVKGRHAWHYELCIDLKDTRWLEIDAHGWLPDYVVAANAIANVMGVPVEQDER